MDRSSAIANLRAEGFIVSERTWSLGDSIVVGALPDESAAIRTFKVLEYLYPASEGRWCVTDLRNNGRGSEHPDLASAVDHITRAVREGITAVEHG